MTFDEWFESVYGKPHEDDGLKVLLREAWDAAFEESATGNIEDKSHDRPTTNPKA